MASPEMGVCARVPEDLWRLIFRQLTLEEILWTMRVCSAWRRVGVDSDAYSSDIQLARRSWNAIHFFRLRLGRGGSRPVTIRVHSIYPWDLLSTWIYPAIAEQAGRVRALYLEVHSGDSNTTLDLLRHRFPLMRTLHVHFLVDERSFLDLPVLPPDFLANDAPGLRHLRLLNLDTSQGTIPSSLKNVDDLCLGQHSEGLLPVHHLQLDLLLRFPRLRKLALVGELDISQPAANELRVWRSVTRLTIALNRECVDSVMSQLPITSLPTIHAFHPFASCPTSCLLHLEGPLHMAAVKNHEQYADLCFTDASSRSRIFTVTASPWLPEAAEVLQFPWLWDRITALTVSNTLWTDVVRHIEPLNALVSLRLVMEDNSSLSNLGWDNRPLECPVLRTLALHCGFDTAVLSCEDIAQFVDHALRISTKRGLRLILENVVLQGERADVLVHFKGITYGDSSAWSYEQVLLL